MWRPHNATLVHLSWALAQLSGGRLLKPLQTSEIDDIRDTSDMGSEEEQAHDRLDLHARRTIEAGTQFPATAWPRFYIEDCERPRGSACSESDAEK